VENYEYKSFVESVEYNKIKDLVIDYTKPRDILKRLKERLCPTETDRRSELRHRYRKLFEIPKAQNRERWIDEWRDVVRRRDLEKANKLDARNAKEDFFSINKEIDVTVAEIIWDRDQDKDESFHDFTERFVKKYRENALQSQRSDRTVTSTFATIPATSLHYLANLPHPIPSLHNSIELTVSVYVVKSILEVNATT
jgi:hypothetical protein